MQSKIGSVLFEHAEDFSAEVTITSRGSSVTVPFSALTQIVGESVRHDLIAKLEKATPTQLLQDRLVKKLA